MNTKLNDVLTLTIKSLAVVALMTGTFVVGNNHYNNQHHGHSCDAKQIAFWLGQSKTEGEGVIVSIYEDKVQRNEGTTTCKGLFLQDGEFKDWVGSVSETTRGDIGWAKVKG